MAGPHDHHDDHEHGACCAACGPGSSAPAGSEHSTDPGARHLASALRLSFFLLGAIMVLGVLTFLAMGIQFIRPGEVAVLTVFGRVVGTTTEGLAYNWPAPIGRIERVGTAERKIAVSEFWMFEAKDDQLKELSKREVPPGGLRSGYDGALLTGDRNLLHIRLTCTYAVGRKPVDLPLPPELAAALAQRPDQPVGPLLAARPAQAEDHPAWRFLRKTVPLQEALGPAVERWIAHARREPALLLRENVADVEEMMRSVLCDAAVRSASVRTADGLQRTARSAFEREVHQIAQRRLDGLMSGLLVKTVKVDQSTWPLRTRADYEAASRAISEADKLKNAARGDAISMFNAAAGPAAARKLVGDPADLVGRASGEVTSQPAGEADYNLIGQYHQAVRDGQTRRAAELLARIEDVLVGQETLGTARTILSEASTYRSAIVQEIKARVTRFKELLPAYRRNPQFAVGRWWVEAREEILSSPTVEKHYIGQGSGKTILRISRDPEIARRVREELLRSGQRAPLDAPPRKE